jgi:hypothetical protein
LRRFEGCRVAGLQGFKVEDFYMSHPGFLAPEGQNVCRSIILSRTKPQRGGDK